MTEGADAVESHDANAKDRHVHYEDHFSSASDDDMNAVEVCLLYP